MAGIAVRTITEDNGAFGFLFVRLVFDIVRDIRKQRTYGFIVVDPDKRLCKKGRHSYCPGFIRIRQVSVLNRIRPDHQVNRTFIDPSDTFFTQNGHTQHLLSYDAQMDRVLPSVPPTF
jgi:hypothetical protein